MTTTVALSFSESLTIGRSSVGDQPSGTDNVIVRSFDIARPVPLKNTTSLKSLTERYEANPARAALLAAARKKVSSVVYKEQPVLLSMLRMQAGLSQAQLATQSGLTQVTISRIERGSTDPGTQTIKKIADVLGLHIGEVCTAIANQISSRG
jgi:DNA-binding XRE family transcriptional regulator